MIILFQYLNKKYYQIVTEMSQSINFMPALKDLDRHILLIAIEISIKK